MSVQLLKTPAEISFSRNAVEFQFQTDALLQSPGSAFKGSFWLDGSNGGSTFTLSYGDVKLTFTLSPNPDDSGYQLPIRTYVQADAEYMPILAAAFRANFYLQRDFNVTVADSFGSPRVYFEAKNTGSGYNLQADTGIYTTQIGADAVPNKNFKLYTELWIENATRTSFVKVSDPYLEVNTDGRATLDVSGQLTDALLADGFDNPDFVNPIASVNTKSIRRFYLKYAEAYGDTQTIRRLTQTPYYYTLLGGISKEMLADYKFPDSLIAGPLLKFLKQERAEKYILPEQPEFLSIVAFNQAHSGAQLKFKIYYADDSTAVVYKHALGNIDRYAKLTFPVGFTQNNLNLITDAKVVFKYEVCLVNSADAAITETKTYWLDYESRQYARCFLYLSSWGTYDTQVTYGKGSTQYDVAINTADLGTSIDFKLADGEQINYATTLTAKETVTSGYRSKAEIRLFKDLALTSDMLLYRKKRVYAVAFASKTIKEFKDAENLHAISFDFGFRYAEDVYTVDDRDEQDTPLFLPLKFALAPNAPEPSGDLDYRYYKKVETYNQVEIDAKLGDATAQTVEVDEKYTTITDGLKQDVASKAPIVHDHDDRYYTRAEVNDMLIDGLTGLTEDVTFDIQAGAINAGDTIKKGTDLTQLAKLMGYKVFTPVLVNPSFGLAHQEPAQIEVGTVLTVDLVFTFNRGKYQATWPGGADLPAAGEASGYRFWNQDGSGFQIVGSPNYQKQNYVTLLGANTFAADVIYNAGPQAVDSKGKNYLAPLPGDISPRQSASFTGVYRHFYGPVAAVPGTPAAARLASSQLSPVNSFTLNTGTEQKTLVIITSPDKSLASVVDLDSLSANITSEYAYQGTISVNDAGGNAVPGFKLYVYQMDVAYKTSHRHQITLK